MMPKEPEQLQDFIAGIRENKTAADIGILLGKAAAAAAELPPRVPGWLSRADREGFPDPDALLKQLPNRLKKLYNDEKKQVAVFSADISTARMAYEAARPVFNCSLLSALAQGSGNVEEAHAVFLYIPPYERTDFHFRCSRAVLISPERFTSQQLKAVEGHLAADCKVALWDLGGGRAPLAGLVRKNDGERLDYLLARWEIGKSGQEKEKQLMDILSFLEAMAGWVDDE